MQLIAKSQHAFYDNISKLFYAMNVFFFPLLPLKSTKYLFLEKFPLHIEQIVISMDNTEIIDASSC